MGRSSWMRRVDEEDGDGERYNPGGCMWKRFRYALDYHHWHYNNVKKKLMHKLLNDGRRHDKNKTKLVHNDATEAQRLLGDEETQLQVNQKQKKAGLNNKRSLRARIKALIQEQNQEVKNKKQQGTTGNYKHSKYQRTYPIHHVEPTDDDHNWKHPIYILPGTPNKGSKKDKEEIAAKEKSYVPKKQLNKDKDSLELFLKILQGSEIGNGKFSQNQKASRRKIGLTKCGSFPLYDSKRGDYKPLKLEDKQKEVWSKVERLEDDNQAPNLAMPKYAKDLLESLGLTGDEEDNRTLNRASTLDFRCKAAEQEKEEDTAVNLPVKEVAEIDESQTDQGDMAAGSHSTTTQETAGTSIPKSSFVHRRSSSLNESLHRYSRLYDHSFGKEVELKPSRSLKVANERMIPSIPFRRINSLSMESSYFVQLELLGSTPFSDHTVRTAEESSSMNVTSDDEENPESKEKSASLDAMEETGDQSEQAGNNDDEVSPDMEELSQSNNLDSNVETCFQEDYQIPKEDTCNHAKEKAFAINSSDSFCTDSDSPQNITNVEKPYKHSQSYTRKMDDPDLCFVMAILECSGFTENFFQGTWYSSEQPLNPSVFEEVESCWDQEFQSPREEIFMFFHHQMLFDLINEVLVQMYDRSFRYYPAALSSCTRIRPSPTGNHIVAEVCSNISSLLNLKPEAKQSLDSIVGRDLEKDYGWMNLQKESEFVALEVEGILFEDLLDEILNPDST